jgi:hypothetical protein
MGKSFSIPLFYIDALDNNALKLLVSQTVSLREEPYNSDLYFLAETIPGTSGVYKNDDVEDKTVRLFINGNWKQEYGTFRTYGDLSNLLSDYIKKDGSVAFTGHANHGGNRIYNVGDPSSGIDIGDRDFNDGRYILKEEGASYWQATGNLLIVDAAVITPDTRHYSTIQSAINYAQSQTPSSSNQWTIYIIPKKTVDGYMENITLQPYVHLAGLGRITRVKGNITGMNLNTKLSNLFFFQEGNFTVQNIKADNCIFHTSGDPEVEIFTLTLQSGVFKNCGFFGTRYVLSNGNNRFYGSCFCNKTDEKNSSDIGELYSLNNSAELYQL